MPRLLLALSALVLLGCPRYDAEVARAEAARSAAEAAEAEGEVAEAGPFEDWYPDDVTPPEGTEYPCALTALPRELPGIPAADRRYINHTYSMLLQATQAKLPLLQDVYAVSNDGQQRDLVAGFAEYELALGEAIDKVQAEAVPAGLEPFQEKVVQAMTLQRTFFEKAVVACQASKPWQQVISIPEGRQASGLLLGAWGDMQRRYPSWTPELKDSIYHHLCALDLF